MSDVYREELEDELEIEVVDEEAKEQEAKDKAQFSIFTDKKIEEDFINYLQTEIDESFWERSPRFAKIRTWRRMADNINTSGRDPAWEGASDVNVPVIPILLKTASARLRNTFNARKPFWNVAALSKEPGNPWIRRSEVLEKYYNMISTSKYDLNLYKQNNSIMTDLPIAGTVWVRVPWTHLERNLTMEGYDENGEALGDTTIRQVVHSGPEILPTRVENVFFREQFQDPQSAPWIAIQNPMSWYEVTMWRDNGYWKNVDKLAGSGRSGVDEMTEFEDVDQQLRDVHVQPGREETTNVWDIMECWVYFDVNGDGIYEDVLAYYHRKSNTLLSAEFNRLGERMIRNVPFYLRPYAMEGQAVTELSADLQDEINALHNMRNDGIHLTESAQYAVRRGSGIRPKEKMRPGKVFFLDDPTTDIRLLQNSKSYVETSQLENLDYTYLERVTGIQDIAGGFSSMLLKSRDTASSQGMRLQAGSEVFMGIIEGIDLAYQDIAEMLFRQMIAHKTELLAREREAERLTPDEIKVLEDIFNMDVHTVPYVMAFKARLVEEAETYDGKKQSLLTLITVYTQFATQIIPLIMQTYQNNPQIVQIFMQKFVEGATKLMQDVFTFFGQDDVDDYLITSDKVATLNQITKMLGAQLGQMGQIPGQGMTPGPQGPVPGGGQMPPMGGSSSAQMLQGGAM